MARQSLEKETPAEKEKVRRTTNPSLLFGDILFQQSSVFDTHRPVFEKQGTHASPVGYVTFQIQKKTAFADSISVHHEASRFVGSGLGSDARMQREIEAERMQAAYQAAG